ncbi:MAG: DMT family transporter [Betaproteobacteria bacterium]|nr:MAG: DMT family transporter [Betaproteobacteria bacterium]
MIDLATQRYALLALAAAALFGASTPLAKLLQADITPGLLAGLLYLGSGIGLALVQLARRFGRAPADAPLRAEDIAWLAGAVLCGGIAAPVLLLWGLAGASASGVSLLLNLEGLLTALIAALVFKEAVGKRIWLAACLMLAAALLLSYDAQTGIGLSLHALAVAAACALWALDNNLTRRIAAADAVNIAMIKGLAAGCVNTAAAMALGAHFPNALPLAGALMLGWLAYGISLTLYIVALRHLGSARAAAHFSTAPFIGAALAIALLGEPVSAGFVAAFLLMVAATWLALSEQHGHAHVHEPLAHQHQHTHDAHHQHEHRGDEGPEPHAHAHRHASLEHSHPHLPDLHHRHPH